MKNKKYIKVYGIENLQNIFIYGFIINEFLDEYNKKDYYLVEINYKKDKKEYYNISDINRVFFIDESSMINFKATTYFNLPIYEKLLKVNELIFNTEIEKNNIFGYKKELVNKFKNNNFNGINIDLKLGLLSSIYYFFQLDKKNIVNVSGLFSILKVRGGIEEKYKDISNYYKNIFHNNDIIGEQLKNYKTLYKFDEISLIYSILGNFLNGNNFQKRIYDLRFNKLS